jgi:hypothetical protein
MEREEPVAAELLRKMAPLLATSPSDHRSKERELAAALDRSRSGGEDLDHRLLYGHPPKTVATATNYQRKQQIYT